MGKREEAQYLRVAAALRRQLKTGKWTEGQQLPARSALAKEHRVSRQVMEQAMELLMAEGLLEGRAGVGTFVRAPRERQRMVRSAHRENFSGSPFRGEMAARGRAGSWESDSKARVAAPAEIAARLAVEAGAPCVCTTYEYLADGKPVQLSTSWEPVAITDGSPVLLPEMGPYAGAGVVARMRAIGVTVQTVQEVPRPGRATRAESNLLGVPLGDAVLRIERTYFTSEGVPVETADIVVPDARWEVAYTWRLDPPDGSDGADDGRSGA
ncbi:GntR family transcriptional regulator [Streptomyces nanshensis]|uniref:GntR family transcriptional regulator n=1 Tax=Streptomyces nanshensis TaxID=518642 RepID=A0A1E7L404_9ACTN|nr:GntR family transcriptional regulator [Streptomyces nanshensis]OEV10915.1 GntR family transcriptional regulator [Streptomyces nanshensis]